VTYVPIGSDCSFTPTAPICVTSKTAGSFSKCFSYDYSKDCSLFSKSASFYFLKVQFKIEKRFQIMNLGKPTRKIVTVTYANDNNYTSVSEWDGRSLLKTQIHNQDTYYSLISTTNKECPDLSSKYLVLDTFAPFDAYLIERSEINDCGSSDVSKLFPICIDLNGDLKMNDASFKSSFRSKVVYSTDTEMRVSMSYNGRNEPFYIENLKNQKLGVKSSFFDTMLYDRSKFAQNDNFAKGKNSFSHINAIAVPKGEYEISGVMINKLNFFDFVGIEGQSVQIGYYKTKDGNDQYSRCYFVDSFQGTFNNNGFVRLLGCDGLQVELFCNSVFNKTDVNNQTFVAYVKNVYGECVKYSHSASASTSPPFTNSTVRAPDLSFTLKPESSSSISLSLQSSFSFMWSAQTCSPHITEIVDNSTEARIRVKAYSSQGEATAVLLEDGQLSSQPVDVYLTSVEKYFYLSRTFNTSGNYQIKLCCGEHCDQQKVKVSSFPYIPRLNTSENEEFETGDISTEDHIANFASDLWKGFKSVFSLNFSDLYNVLWSTGKIAIYLVVLIVFLYLLYKVIPFFYKVNKKIAKKALLKTNHYAKKISDSLEENEDILESTNKTIRSPTLKRSDYVISLEEK